MADIGGGQFTSSAVSSVLYHKNTDSIIKETKGGAFIYFGDAHSYHEWEFRTRLRLTVRDPEFYPDAVSKVVEGLRGNAFTVAQEMGFEMLTKPIDYETRTGGGDMLILKMKEMVFPLTTHEAKELFRQFTKHNGVLTRQSGESMQHYIGRRARCWKLLNELDPELKLSEGHRADMLLDMAGIDKVARTMIQASIGNSRDLVKVAEALTVQHPRIHIGEQRKSGAFPKGKGGGKGRGRSYPGKGGKKGKGKNSSNTAFLATEYEYEDWAEDEWDEPTAYPAYEDDDDEDDVSTDVPDYVESSSEDPIEVSELESAAYICSISETSDDFESLDADATAEYIQTQTIAFLAYKGKGKGRGKPSGGARYPIRPSNLSLQDRRKKLAELKAKTTCKLCGRKGHWAGDPGCSMSKQDTKVARMATRMSSYHQAVANPSYFTINEDESDDGKTACLSTLVDNTLIGYDPWTETTLRSEKVAFMAFRRPAKVVAPTPSAPEQAEANSAFPDNEIPLNQIQEGWTVMDGPEPVGHDVAFAYGTFKGSSFSYVLKNFPNQFLIHSKSKKRSVENTAFVEWVTKNYTVDEKTLHVRRKGVTYDK